MRHGPGQAHEGRYPRMNKRASVIQRRLAAIFYADVAGYVRLMNADEIGTLALLDSRREIMDRHITQHGGRTANTAGDSILAEFPSVVDAVRCAVGIQEGIGLPRPTRKPPRTVASPSASASMLEKSWFGTATCLVMG
jgi:adenylate cyclase